MPPRRATFAGSWYPDGEQECRLQIEAFLRQDFHHPELPGAPRAGIVPHAGWYFSGAIACHVIQALAGGPRPDAVALFGRHMHPNQRPVIMDRGSWDTPLGALPVAQELAAYLTARFGFVIEGPTDPNQDNTIELQLPFIKHFFGPIPILPIGVPPSKTALEIAASLVEGARALKIDVKILGSTDLTHYGPNYGFTTHGRGSAAADWVREKNDRRFIEAALRLNPAAVIEEGLRHRNACCAGAAAAAIQAGLGMGVTEGVLMAQTTSYAKAPGESVVGYAGMAFG